MYCLGFSPMSNKMFMGLINGACQCAFINAFQPIHYKNLIIEFPSENSIKISDINSNYSETNDYPEKQILGVEPFND